MKDYEHVKTQENGDATCNYHIKADYPIPFAEFYKNILAHTKSFRVQFYSQNKRYGGWPQNELEFNNHDDKWHIYKKDAPLLEKFEQEKVVKCWANGGWGQMTYFVTFEEKE